jgi:hypothetical protein
MKVYDLREFFGGMSCYHNGEAMARCLGVQNPERFTNGFMEDSLDGSRPDPVMLPSKVAQPNGEIEYCIGLRVWDLLLWFAIIGRPRRDVGILTDFAKTMAQYSMQILPRSILPYSLVPMTRLDPVEKKQVVMDLQGNSNGGGGGGTASGISLSSSSSYVPRPLVIVRPTNTSILTRNFKPDYEGLVGTKVLEDEMYMSEILEMSADLSLNWKQLPIAHLPTLNVHWEYGMCYPMGRYIVATADKSNNDSSQQEGEMKEDLEEETFSRCSSSSLSSSCSHASVTAGEKSLEQVVERMSSVDQCAMFLHPTRYSMMLWVMDAASRKAVEEETDEDCLPDDWAPNMVLAHEFSLLPCLYPHGYPNHAELHCLVSADDEEEDQNDDSNHVDLLLTTSCRSIQVFSVVCFFIRKIIGSGPATHHELQERSVIFHYSVADLLHATVFTQNPV